MTAGRCALALVVVAGMGVGAERVRAEAPATATLSVWHAGAWRPWWRADHAPTHWAGADSIVAAALSWERLAPGLEWASLRLAGAGPAWRTRLIVARLDPNAVVLSLAMALGREDGRPAWSIDRAPEDAVLAVNAGQFVGAMPWGWVFVDGRQRLRPGSGPLASSIAIDSAGRVGWRHGDTLAASGGAVAGFQSYPTLLGGAGVVPAALRPGGRGVNLAHRDARLALGQTWDGRLLVVLTRFDALGDVAAAVPIGPTTPEMAAILGALGASDAVMLDGGISAQLLLRDAARAEPLRWPGLRKVPLALIARARSGRTP